MSTLVAFNLQAPGGGGTAATLASINGGPLAGARNRIINGDMRIDQRNAGAIMTPTAGTTTYTLDRWAALEDTDGSVTVQQSTTAPAGFKSSLLLTVSSIDATLAATQRMLLYQNIEGFNTADLNFGAASAVAITLSFWVRSSVTGTFGGAVNNAGGGGVGFTSYPFSYVIFAANTWEYKTVSISGSTSGTWLADNRSGLTVIFSLGVGNAYSGPANTWAASDLSSATGTTNLMAINGATFFLTGVQLEPGPVATPFERRPIGVELALCQRYYEKSYDIGTAVGSNTGVSASIEDFYIAASSPARVRFAVSKRGAPTVNVYDSVGNASRYTRNSTDTNITPIAVDNAGTSGFKLFTEGTAQTRASFHWQATSEL